MNTTDSEVQKIEDLGIVISALLEPEVINVNPGEIVGRALNQSRSRFRRTSAPVKLPMIDGLVPLRLAREARVFVGGSGVVIQCANAEVPEVTYALKVIRPSLVPQTFAEAFKEIEKAKREFVYHAPLSHQNIARVISVGTIPPAGGRPPLLAILMEWINGAMPLLDFLIQRKPSYFDLVKILRECFSALEYLHSKDLVHWDIKSQNLLVDDRGIVKLTDIGNARRIKDPECGDLAFSTAGNYPEVLEPKDQNTGKVKSESSNRNSIRLPDESWDSPWLDLWMLGRELNRFFIAIPELCDLDLKRITYLGEDWKERRNDTIREIFPATQRDAGFGLRYLQTIIRRLLYPKSPSESSYYDSASRVVRDLDKLEPEFGAAQNVEEIHAIPQRVLRLPHSGNVPWSYRVHHLFNSNVIQRLSRHSQLGSVAHVYPGGSHKRSEHVAGVLSTTIDYIRALYADRTDPFWRLNIEAADIHALLFAALVHDVGHLAFGHFLEEMHGLFAGVTHEDYVIAVLDPTRSTDNGLSFGGKLEEQIRNDRDELLGIVRNHWMPDNSSPERFLAYVADVLRPQHRSTPVLDEPAILDSQKTHLLKLEILHSILDSPIDADKLDYLFRDAHHAGVQYSHGIDRDRFFQSLTVVYHLNSDSLQSSDDNPFTSSPRACVAVTRKGILPLESMLIGRYQMFSSVYWQHTTRAETAMLQFVIQKLLSSAKDKIRELDEILWTFRELDDRAALLWLNDRISLLRSGRSVSKRLLENICQALLGKRDSLYWTAYELSYEQSDATRKESLYTNLAEITDRVNAAGSLEDYLEGQVRLRNFVTQQLSNDMHVRLDEGEVLLDIPEPNKDQVQNVFVVDARSRPRIRPVQELSPVSNAVSSAFRYWARPIRVFVAPSAWSKFYSKKIDETIAAASVEQVLESLAHQRESQIYLPLKSSDSPKSLVENETIKVDV